MFWSPVVPVGYITRHLSEINGLNLVINGEYKRRVNCPLKKAKKTRYWQPCVSHFPNHRGPEGRIAVDVHRKVDLSKS